MPRTCTICTHADRAAIDQALLNGEPFRHIAERTGTSTTALTRHKAEHISSTIAKARDAVEVAQADDLLREVRQLKAKAVSLLLQAEQAGDYRTALAGIREARACVELLLEVEGELDRRPIVNVTVSTEWLTIRTTLLDALSTHPEARHAVVVALGKVDSNAAP